jgi:hypothetical protein
LKPGAGITDIKRNYRTKAKRYHPDVNPSDQAHKKFIQINEAYQVLLHYKRTGRFTKQYHKETGNTTDTYEEWLQKERARARAQAAYNAKMKYEEFLKSPLYKSAQIMFTFFDVVYFVVGLAAIIGPVFHVLTADLSDEDIYLHIMGLFFAIPFGIMLITSIFISKNK